MTGPSSEPTKVDTGEPEPVTIPRSHSADEVDNTTISSPPDVAPVARATTVDAAGTAGVSTSPAVKRKSWFSSGQDEVDSLVSAPSGATGSDEPVSRGRSLGPDVTERPSSLPNFNTQSDAHESTLTRDEDTSEGHFLSPKPSTRRASSQHSRRSASSRAASVA